MTRLSSEPEARDLLFAQYLTPEAGKPRLKELLEAIKALMRVSTDWDDFQIKLDIAFPRFDETFALPFEGGLPRLPKPN